MEGRHMRQFQSRQNKKMEKDSNLKIIYDSFKKVYGHPCWDVTTRYGLAMEFGKPQLEISLFVEKHKYHYKPKRITGPKRYVSVRGQWKLWIFMAHWKMSYKGKKIVTSSSSDYNLNRAASHLSGQKLVNIEVNPKTGATKFDFDLGCTIEARRWQKDSKDDLWYLYIRDKYCLTMKGDGSYTYEVLGNKMRGLS